MLYPDKAKNFLLILGGGGHTEQMLRLSRTLTSKSEITLSYALQKEDRSSVEKIKTDNQIYVVDGFFRVGESNTKMLIKCILSPCKVISLFINVCRILQVSKADVVIGCGPYFTIPFLIIAKALRIKTIFIESWSRVTTKSVSGFLAYYLADLFFIQWREMLRAYPKARYRGRLG